MTVYLHSQELNCSEPGPCWVIGGQVQADRICPGLCVRRNAKFFLFDSFFWCVEIGSAAHFSSHRSHKHTTSSGVFGGHFPDSPEASHPHCKDEALVIKHIPNTAKFAHLHTHNWLHI